MPNGRSGGFPIERDALHRLLGGLAGDLQVGRMRDESLALLEVTVAQLQAMIDTRGGRMIAVEEQDHSFYVIHVQNSPVSVWVVVHGESPLLPVLRQQHEAWVAEHPYDRSWMAF